MNMRTHGMAYHKMPLFCWAILVTAVLLLLSLPVLAGIFKFVPALNLPICWEHLFKSISQSAVNLLDFNPWGIFREYTPELIHCNSLILFYPPNFSTSSLQVKEPKNKILLLI